MGSSISCFGNGIAHVQTERDVQNQTSIDDQTDDIQEEKATAHQRFVQVNVHHARGIEDERDIQDLS